MNPGGFGRGAQLRILVLEDDRETARALEVGLSREAHEVVLAHDVQSAIDVLDRDSFDAAVLDVAVPGGSGLDVLTHLRSTDDRTVVLMLTARGTVEDRVHGLDRGADDYLVKPFAFDELAARLRALARRPSSPPTELRAGPLTLDLTRQLASISGARLELTPTEFGLLATLLRAHGETVDRNELLREVWGYDFDPTTNVVDVHVNRLRRKLEAAGLASLIKTIRGRGYAAC